jgi:hypothetical protein
MKPLIKWQISDPDVRILDLNQLSGFQQEPRRFYGTKLKLNSMV